MAEVKVFYDRTGNTLVVWFGNPQDEVILMKDQQGQVIGFETLNFLPPSSGPVRITFETIAP
ncbi:DUF2283 domain-containing protein [Thermosynechococcus sp. QKsg1]|uniref:DUF2283 domain-containing protein n=1 Tax=unclassified Thermosynechococcus TaxID=2622553 RepID=UPI00122E9AAA|nr:MULTISPECIES: DUF2283 domain-containing protein [unclassified Thermosynechococcus]QEQ01548.1 DUF2283 domain-containing protein [Thermosynechococcus sp. CL-1]WJI23409.1 DUF2283 domain-containing protein [Thermosynechococcus sp. B0]WJI25923.1 DUF2283 domain-containing protein [Thermosynechococcus sp. B1]WJI28451.1 DUF2283 domain-containing protein [Thermosynechococcus sp. B3]WKT83034.1 DUF2283 domain-containing protein [Thermosynechococcus sp. HY596]